MMRDSAEERAQKRRRTKVGGEVPANSEKFVTDAVHMVRDRVVKRQAAKEQYRGAPATKASARPCTSRWVARPSTAGQTASSANQPTANPGVIQQVTDILLPKKLSGFGVLARRRFYKLRNVVEMAERATRKRTPPAAG